MSIKLSPLQRWQRLAVVVCATLYACVALYSLRANVVPDPDAFYHMKTAQIIARSGLIYNFNWLPYSTLAHHFTDQHLLLHITLIPFVTLLPPFLGVKLYVVLFGTLSLVGFAMLLRYAGLRWWWLVALTLSVTTSVTFRLDLLKATALALVVLYFAIWCLIKRRYRLLFITSIVYVWTYGGFAMLGVVAGLWSLAYLIAHIREVVHPITWFKLVRELTTPVALVFVGLFCGVIINPYFPNNVSFYWEQLIQIGVVNYQNVIGVGAEWYPYPPGNLAFGLIVLIALWLVGVVAVVIQRKRFEQIDWFATLLGIAGIVLTLKSRRYVEYGGPFLAISVAVYWQAMPRLTTSVRYIHLYMFTLFCLCLMCVVPVVLNDVDSNQVDLQSGQPENYLAGASTWLRQHAKPGAKILHSDWDEFPALFYYNSKSEYMAGLDPTFTYRADPNRYWLWVQLTTGTFSGDLTSAFTTLDVHYALVDKDHIAMRQLIASAPTARVVYEDAQATVFSLRKKIK